MMRNTRDAIQHALAFAYEGSTATANYLAYLCPIDRSPTSQGLQIAMAVQSAKIRAAVNEQPSPINDWLNLCYGPDVEAFNKPSKNAHIAAVVTKEAFSGHNRRKADKLYKIAYIAVHDYRVGVLMGRELPLAPYLEATGTSDKNWSRDWEKYRRDALMRLRSYDTDGIAQVERVVRAICKAENS